MTIKRFWCRNHISVILLPLLLLLLLLLIYNFILCNINLVWLNFYW